MARLRSILSGRKRLVVLVGALAAAAIAIPLAVGGGRPEPDQAEPIAGPQEGRSDRPLPREREGPEREPPDPAPTTPSARASSSEEEPSGGGGGILSRERPPKEADLLERAREQGIPVLRQKPESEEEFFESFGDGGETPSDLEGLAEREAE